MPARNGAWNRSRSAAVAVFQRERAQIGREYARVIDAELSDAGPAFVPENRAVELALHHLAFADGRRDLHRWCSGRAGKFPCARSLYPRRGASCRAGQRITLRRRQPIHPRSARDQQVPIVWTNCALGGKRPWFICTSRREGRYCGRRVAKLYLRDNSFFACRHCCRLVYASQQESPRFRSISIARRIRIKLGGSASLADPFPQKPPRMHWRTYQRLRARALAAETQAGLWLIARLKQW